MTQRIRPSQFILTYGPGAILEGKKGPRLIPRADIGLFDPTSQFNPWDYRIDDDRMSKGILDGANIFRLPSNAELELAADKHIYRTKPFPSWKLCLNQNQHGGSDLLYGGQQCPICLDASRGRQEAIRFVMACRDGHLNDVPWGYLVHSGRDCPETKMNTVRSVLRRADSYLWHRRGGTLSDINIECPRCGVTKNFGQMYYNPIGCSRRHPEREVIGSPPNTQGNCSREAKIIQRQAANLRIPEIRTLLSIQSTYTNLHRIMENRLIKKRIESYEKDSGQKLDSKEKFLKKIIDDLLESNDITDSTADAFRQATWEEIREARTDSSRPIPTTYHELIMDEFSELIKGSKNGAPPVKTTKTKRSSKIIFEMDPNQFDIVATDRGTKFRICPIQILRTVTVQTGFRREISDSDNTTPPKLVKIDFTDSSGRMWYPGVEFLGEGIFIRLESDDGWRNNLDGDNAKKWLAGLSNADKYTDFVFRDGANSRDELHPGFVWWHTFSHMLIRSIGEESGYSSASIRERIYFEHDEGRFRGGIVLYATQPGNEGTLGGLLALAPSFKNIFHGMLEQIEACSGDPLCIEQKFGSGGYNGATCYGCLMNSETSCEHRNMWLDRHVVLENMP